MTKTRAILTDIEGTTTPIAFVKNVLFPYARARMHGFVHAHACVPPVRAALEDVAATTGGSLDRLDPLCDTLVQWIDEDRKATALKLLQGLIWDAGYAEGTLRAPVYPDAVHGLRAWRQAGLQLYVYSSGSVHAQRLLFQHSDHGNLLALFSGHFDTTSGGKREAAAYAHIADSIARPAAEILFLSDISAELDAAAATGMRTTWLLRPEDSSATPNERAASAHPIATSFASISL